MSDSAGDAEVLSVAGRVIEPGSLPGVGGLGPGFEGGDSVAAPLSAFIAGDLIDHIDYTAMFPSFAAVVIAALLSVATLRVGAPKRRLPVSTLWSGAIPCLSG